MRTIRLIPVHEARFIGTREYKWYANDNNRKKMGGFMMYPQHPHLTQVQTRNNHARRSLWKPNPLAAAIVATCSGLSAASLPASAQELEEILVTATRRETAITDIPFNISVVSGEDLKAMRAFGLGDLSRIVPGIALQDEGHLSRGTIIILSYGA